MSEIPLPYGKSHVSVKIPDRNLIGIYNSRIEDSKVNCSEFEIVQEALNNQIDSSPLEELAVGKAHVVIITSDHTRPVPCRSSNS